MAFVSTCAALVLALAQTTFADNSTNNTCQSYGVDYQNGGSYFQNSNVNNTFTATQQFSGCTDDWAHNVIVDPNGDEFECTGTQMQPSNTDMIVTCSNWTNSNMYSGDWSLLVVSNNGNMTPIAYQRDFSLSVGQPAATVSAAPTVTNTYSTTVTETTTSTSIVAYTTAVVDTSNSSTTSTAASSTASGSSSTDSSSSSSYAADSSSSSYASGSSSSWTGSASSSGSDGTATVTSYFAVTSIFTQNGTSCSAGVSTPASTSASVTPTSSAGWRYPPDPMAKFAPSVLGEALDSLVASIISKAETGAEALKARATQMPASAKFRKAIIEGRSPDAELKRAFVKERAAFLHGENALAKRSPDSETSTIYTGTTTYTTETTMTYTETAYTSTTSTSTQLNIVGRDNYLATITSVIPTTIIEVVCATA